MDATKQTTEDLLNKNIVQLKVNSHHIKVPASWAKRLVAIGITAAANNAPPKSP